MGNGANTNDAGAASRRRVIVVAPSVLATFIRQDVELLRSVFDVDAFSYRISGSLVDMSQRIDRADVVVVWFAGRHSIPAAWLARRHKKPMIQIVGGYEATWVPEIGYGIDPASMRARVLRWVLHHATVLLAVSRDTESGILRIAPDVGKKVRLIYNGVDTAQFSIDETVPRRGVLSVGMMNESTLVKKGWKLFWKTAEAMPDVPFTAVGPALDQAARDLVAHCPPNLIWLGELQGQELLAQFRTASVYFQGSRHESFSLSLAEGMACGCMPVVTRYGALPEVAGELGFYCDDLTPESAERAVRAALAAPPNRRVAVRQRIIDNFDVGIRRQKLLAIVEETLSH